MKKQLTLIFALLITTLCWSQNGINYKAIIKDASGNVISNGEVIIQFTILKTSEMGSVAYQENQTITTDANGLLITTIGEGFATVSTFDAVKWENDSYFLKVEVSIGSGLVDMGTTEFNAVPYALNVSGLEAIDEGNGIGWRLKGRSSVEYADIGLNAIDFSIKDGGFALDPRGASGDLSFAIGRGTLASGYGSIAIGYGTTASGFYSTAMGSRTEASGDYSIAMGQGTGALGYGSFTMGESTVARASYETVIGYFNTVYTPTANNSLNRLFSIGNGDIFNLSDALVVLGNGKITAPSLTVDKIDDDKSLITKEYFEAESTMGLEQLDEGNGIGWRLADANPDSYGDIGRNAVDLSFALGNSTARGATGQSSTALGNFTTASGEFSTATGVFTTASGDYATAMGYSITAQSGYETTIGNYNTNYTPNNTNSFNALDRLFVIGNGTSDNSRSNALTLLKNGNLGLGFDTPNVRLHIISPTTEDANADNGKGSIVVGAINSENIAIDRNEIMARNNNAPATLNLQKDGGNVKVGGSIVHTSDRRLKRDISELPYGLKEILQLQPKEYYWKNRTQDHKSLGLIAQEVETIIANVVTTENDEAKTLGVSYTELIPVLIKAIQEQQELIKALQLKVDNQETFIRDRDSKIEGLTAQFNQRLMQIETLLKVTQQ